MCFRGRVPGVKTQPRALQEKRRNPDHCTQYSMGSYSKYLITFLLILAVPEIRAQDVGQVVHTHARPGYPTITIYVLGNASQSGIWRVEQNIPFIELLTVLNVARTEQVQAETRTRVQLALYRTSGGGRSLVYESSFEDAILENASPPGIQDQDVLVVTSRTNRRFSLRTITTVVGSISAVLLLAIRISNL